MKRIIITMPYTDSHCHLQDRRIAKILPELLASARASGVDRFVCCGSSEDDWEDVLALTSLGKGLIPMLGLHPWYVGRAKSGWDTRLRNLLKTHAAGIGECGLDYAIPEADREAQLSALETQWSMATGLNRPLTLHCRKAFDTLFALAEKHGLPNKGAVIHAFSGSAEQAKMAIRHGFFISFACSLMNPKNKRARKALREVPPDRLLLETDTPDIPPTPGTLNEPKNLVALHKAAADLTGLNLEKLLDTIQENAGKIFGFD